MSFASVWGSSGVLSATGVSTSAGGFASAVSASAVSGALLYGSSVPSPWVSAAAVSASGSA